MAVFGYTCELITQLKPKQQEIYIFNNANIHLVWLCDCPVNMIYYKYLTNYIVCSQMTISFTLLRKFWNQEH